MRRTNDKRNNISGMISLEACISVLAFMMLMLLMAGLFRMFMAQNATAHAALETAESLALDAYQAEKLEVARMDSMETWKSVNNFLNGLFAAGADENFSSFDRWYDGKESGTIQEKENAKVLLENTVKTRFVAYLTGGDEDEADAMLTRLNVVDGLKGINFSGSRVENGVLYVNIKYKLKYDFQIGGLGQIDVEQESCSKLWK